MADFVPTVDDAVVTALAAAGTISLGKTNTPEFGFPCYTDNDLVGPARCPWDPSRLAGGSSGGAAVAVAAGMVPFAQGSDGGGSIRIPASINGLFGIKPTRGRISNAPLGGDVTGLGTNGPLARTVRDAAAMLDAMAGPVLGDPAWAPPLPPGETFLGAADRRPGRLRIGRYLRVADARHRARAGGRRRRSRTPAQLLESLGHDVEDVPRGLLGPEVLPSFERVWALSGTTLPVPPERVGELRPLTRELRGRGLAMSAQAAMEAMTALRLFSRRFLQATAALRRPAGAGHHDDAAAAGLVRRRRRRRRGLRAAEALRRVHRAVQRHRAAGGERAAALDRRTDCPSAACSSGRPADEATLLALSAQLEAARPWAHRHPAGMGGHPVIRGPDR